MNNGPEFIAKAFIDWAKSRDIHIHHIQPGKPAQNALIERFNRSFREEILDLYIFNSVAEAQTMAEEWLVHYNHARPHESLQHLPPARFFSSGGYIPLMKKGKQAPTC